MVLRGGSGDSDTEVAKDVADAFDPRLDELDGEDIDGDAFDALSFCVSPETFLSLGRFIAPGLLPGCCGDADTSETGVWAAIGGKASAGIVSGAACVL
jgi:hypothetical protein